MAIWVRSYFVTADIERWSRQTDLTRTPPLTRSLGWGIGWGPGTLGIFHSRGESSVPKELARTWIYREFGPKRVLLTAAAPGDRFNLRFDGFQLLYRVETNADGWLSLRLLVLPCWVFLFAAIPPLMWWRLAEAATARCGSHTPAAHEPGVSTAAWSRSGRCGPKGANGRRQPVSHTIAADVPAGSLAAIRADAGASAAPRGCSTFARVAFTGIVPGPSVAMSVVAEAVRGY